MTFIGTLNIRRFSNLFLNVPPPPVFTPLITDLEFEQSPASVVTSQDKPIALHCSLTGMWEEEQEPPDVLWLKDGIPLDFAETNQFQIRTGSSSWTVRSMLK